jgi:mRNA-degrading endonuclease RelE of RelBE toxin-antitoxin system
MKRAEKFLRSLDPKRRGVIDLLIRRITRRDFDGLDIKKLKDEEEIYRVRKGKIRIIFRLSESVEIIDIVFRNDNTY